MPAPKGSTTRASARAQEALERSRRQAEERLAQVQQAIGRELGWVPTRRAWLVPLAGFAAGLAAATLLLGRRRGGQERLEP